MVRLLILILLSASIFSCTSKKVISSKSVTEKKTDSLFFEKKDSVFIEKKFINTTEFTDEIEVIPIDNQKPIVIDGKEYKNVVVRFKKSSRNIVDSTKTEVSIGNQKIIEVKKEEIQKISEKTIEKKSKTILFVSLILMAIGAGLVIRYVLK